MAFGWVEVVEPGLQGCPVDPELCGSLVEVHRPGERFAEGVEVDQAAGHGCVDLGLFTCREDGVVGDGAAADVFDFVGDGAPPFGLQQSAVDGDRLVVKVGQPYQVEW